LACPGTQIKLAKKMENKGKNEEQPSEVE